MVQVIKRNSDREDFDGSKIYRAVHLAYVDAYELQPTTTFIDKAAELVRVVYADVMNRESVGVDEIHEKVEFGLMGMGEYRVAKSYILYRDEKVSRQSEETFGITYKSGEVIKKPLSVVYANIKLTGGELVTDEIIESALTTLPQNPTEFEINTAMVNELKTLIEVEPAYQYIAAKYFLESIYMEAEQENGIYTLEDVIQLGVQEGIYDERMLGFNLYQLGEAIDFDRDELFKIMGIQTLNDRYLSRSRDGKLIETPQYFWMRVAMGLALGEGEEKNERAIEFYNVLSNFYGCSSTPTLFNSGTVHSQMSSCYLLTQEDDLASMFQLYADSAQLSKYAGGLGIDYTPIRAMNAHIKGLNGKSSGPVPFLKIMNDVVSAVNQAGKRRGSAAVYIEPWHADIDHFLDLRKNTGDERRRTHDLNTALWVPDLFMERVERDEHWWLFSPSDVPELHELYGDMFKAKYQEYEARAEKGEFETARKIKAVQLWRQIITALFETGHPWITFKDACNIRSPQDHVGVVHSSNLCTEITLNTSEDEIAVCNLASVNMHRMTEKGYFDVELLKSTTKTLIRMLDNVIDLNFYPVEKAKNANMRHRPIGLGVMGWTDAMWNLNIDMTDLNYGSKMSAILMQEISYNAIDASADLAIERGQYATFKGSKWYRGILPHDTVSQLFDQRPSDMQDMKVTPVIDGVWKAKWDRLRNKIQNTGIRNSNVLAIAPTATIANIQGVTQSVEPIFSNLFAKSNLSGQFTVINDRLVEDLKKYGLWSHEMLETIKYYNGSIQDIDEIPDFIKKKYRTAYEIPYPYIIQHAAARQLWIDQSQSLNLYAEGKNGKVLSNMYLMAWKMGLKTTYYLRSRAATSVDKVTIDANKFGVRPAWSKVESAASKHDVANKRGPKAITSILPDEPMPELRPENTFIVSAKETVDVDRSDTEELAYDDFEDFLCEACQ